jgi:hypothetical protein
MAGDETGRDVSPPRLYMLSTVYASRPALVREGGMLPPRPYPCPQAATPVRPPLRTIPACTSAAGHDIQGLRSPTLGAGRVRCVRRDARIVKDRGTFTRHPRRGMPCPHARHPFGWVACLRTLIGAVHPAFCRSRPLAVPAPRRYGHWRSVAGLTGNLPSPPHAWPVRSPLDGRSRSARAGLAAGNTRVSPRSMGGSQADGRFPVSPRRPLPSDGRHAQ